MKSENEKEKIARKKACRLSKLSAAQILAQEQKQKAKLGKELREWETERLSGEKYRSKIQDKLK